MRVGGVLNFNTLVTAGTILVTLALCYATIDKRLALVEQLQTERHNKTEAELQEIKKELKELTKAVKAS